jgi:hypothetical protein
MRAIVLILDMFPAVFCLLFPSFQTGADHARRERPRLLLDAVFQSDSDRRQCGCDSTEQCRCLRRARIGFEWFGFRAASLFLVSLLRTLIITLVRTGLVPCNRRDRIAPRPSPLVLFPAFFRPRHGRTCMRHHTDSPGRASGRSPTRRGSPAATASGATAAASAPAAVTTAGLSIACAHRPTAGYRYCISAQRGAFCDRQCSFRRRVVGRAAIRRCRCQYPCLSHCLCRQGRGGRVGWSAAVARTDTDAGNEMGSSIRTVRRIVFVCRGCDRGRCKLELLCCVFVAASVQRCWR